ncbi:hypothetical protein CAPTEDRAFT_220147 [Capitella teleta]|uniref:Palmitoyltransferase n=1 Tax=Capitella teleta TaxID=283909 RepID=R7UKE2_CAPTE|nr:hypothetical protein CAPTEDRAFT_220147 [Capitella teleta]|eukprot:ELU06675.1 hypothetical protein CAPTEDRAFT_220147 [Capitella teleta]
MEKHQTKDSTARNSTIIQMHGDTNKQRSKMTLFEKLREAYTERYSDPEVSRLANIAAAAYFHFILHSQVYVTVFHVIPHLFEQSGDMTIYYLKAFVWFVYIETQANWLCLKFYQSVFKAHDDDNPSYEQMTPWERLATSTTSESLKWRTCSVCGLRAPPRSHHCIICNRCVLKRDHHCYMTGVCVGFYNQRYFIVLNFYIAVGSLCGLYFIYQFAKDTFLPQLGWENYVLPYTVYRWLASDGLELHQMLIVFHLCTLWWTGATAVAFFIWQICLIVLGKTDHEVRQGKRVRYTGRVSDSFQSVFGHFWPVNFFFPAVIIFRQEGNGCFWENVKVM